MNVPKPKQKDPVKSRDVLAELAAGKEDAFKEIQQRQVILHSGIWAEEVASVGTDTLSFTIPASDTGGAGAMTRQLLIAIFLLCCAAFVLYYALSATPQALAQAPTVQPAAAPAPAKPAPQLTQDMIAEYFRADAEVARADAHRQAAMFRMILACGEDFSLGQDPKGSPVCVAKPPAAPAKPEAKR